MTSEQYRAAIDTLGWSQLEAGRRLGVSDRTAQRYATTDGPSGPAARLLRVILRAHEAGRVTRAELDRLIV